MLIVCSYIELSFFATCGMSTKSEHGTSETFNRNGDAGIVNRVYNRKGRGISLARN